MRRPRLSLDEALATLGLAVVLAGPAMAAGSLSDNLRIDSEALGYALHYRVYTPDSDVRELPVLYLTDGQWYIDRGELPSLLDRMIAEGRIGFHRKFAAVCIRF